MSLFLAFSLVALPLTFSSHGGNQKIRSYSPKKYSKNISVSEKEELSAKYPSVNIEPIIELFTIFGDFVETTNITETICEDPDDN